MIHKIKRISAFVIISILFFQTGFSQNVDETLTQTIVFKIKEEYRANCLVKQITISEFNTILSLVGVSKLEKIFPNKLKEKRAGNIDLSLIYELKYIDNVSVDEVIRKIKKLKITVYVEPYYLPQLTYTPSDTIFSSQYYMKKSIT